jgi:hypothetical protein
MSSSQTQIQPQTQTPVDNGMVVAAPPEDQKPSFSSSPRSRQALITHRNIPALKTAMSLESAQETIEQKYLKKRMEERPQHNPQLPKDAQMKAIMMKSKLAPSEIVEEKETIRSLAAEEERVQHLHKNNESESSGLTLVLERGVPLLNSAHLESLNNDPQPQDRFQRKSSAGSEISDINKPQFDLDSQDSSRNDTLYGIKGKADGKAMKKIEWLENYAELRLKQNMPFDGPDLARYKKVLQRLDSIDSPITDVPESVTAKTTPDVTPAPITTPSPTVDTDAELKKRMMPESDRHHKKLFEGEDETLDDLEDVESLRKQLAEAKREIEKLRLERALIHAKNEIKKLKTEITYGHEIENEELNIDNVVGVQKSSTSPPASSGALAVKPVKPNRNTFSKVLPANETPQSPAVSSPKRSTSIKSSPRASRLTKSGGSSRWSSIATRVNTVGSEALVEEDELEDYREEKRRRKKKKKFLQDIEDGLVSRDVVAKTKANPQILKQMQSFEFLSFLDSLEGLDGNTLLKSGGGQAK